MVGTDAEPPATNALGFSITLRRNEAADTVLHYIVGHHIIVVGEKCNFIERISVMRDSTLPKDAILTSVHLKFISMESILILCRHQTRTKNRGLHVVS